MNYFTIKKSSIGNYSKKGSVFKAIAVSTESLKKVKIEFSELKQKYTDATHICYAYRIIANNNLNEYSIDSGEPNGSAGLPILNVLKSNKLVNIVVFIIRYYGGNKLGISGLIQSYSNATKDCLQNSIFIKYIIYKNINIVYDYELDKRILQLIKIYNIKIIQQNYSEIVDLYLKLDENNFNIVVDKLKTISNNKIKINYK